jgi:predicted ATPase
VKLRGRERLLARLREGFADAVAGRTVSVFIAGPSGIGKTALARAFVDDLGGDLLCLSARCRERKSHAFDDLGELGRSAVEEAEALARERGVKAPVRFLALLAPTPR